MWTFPWHKLNHWYNKWIEDNVVFLEPNSYYRWSFQPSATKMVHVLYVFQWPSRAQTCLNQSNYNKTSVKGPLLTIPKGVVCNRASHHGSSGALRSCPIKVISHILGPCTQSLLKAAVIGRTRLWKTIMLFVKLYARMR